MSAYLWVTLMYFAITSGVVFIALLFSPGPKGERLTCAVQILIALIFIIWAGLLLVGGEA